MKRSVVLLMGVFILTLLAVRWRHPNTELAGVSEQPENLLNAGGRSRRDLKPHPPTAFYPKPDSKPDPDNASTTANADFIVRELVQFDDPAAEQILSVLEEAGWSKAQQVARFRETYEQLGRIFFADDLIAENRLNMRSASQGLETNGLFSSDMKRESRRQYEILRSLFEGEMRKDQENQFSNVLVSLGPPPNLPMDEFRRRLLEIHPRLPITGTLTNLLPPSSTVVQNEPR